MGPQLLDLDPDLLYLGRRIQQHVGRVTCVARDRLLLACRQPVVFDFEGGNCCCFVGLLPGGSFRGRLAARLKVPVQNVLVSTVILDSAPTATGQNRSPHEWANGSI